MKKIVIIASCSEGFFRLRRQLAIRMMQIGYKVYVIFPIDSDPVYTEKTSSLGINCIETTMQRQGMNPIKDFKTFLDIYKVLKKLQPDIVFSYTAKPVIYGSSAAKLAGIPKIYSLINGLGYAFIGNTIKDRIIKLIASYLYRIGLCFNEKVFFQNPDDKALFFENKIIARTKKTIIVNGSGVDISYFAKEPLSNKQLSFLLMSRLMRDKGIYEFIEAVRIIKKKYPQIIFRIAGWICSNPSAIKQSEFNAWIEEGLIKFYGRLEDVRPAIKNCSVCVLPSYREGTPRAVLEAMSMGRAIITTDTAGCRETVENGVNGFLVPVRNATKLADAIERFILNPGLIEKMGFNSRRIAEKKYDVNLVNQKIISELEL